jgi:hypothetical protein
VKHFPTCTLQGPDGETYQLPQLVDLPSEFLEETTLIGGLRGERGSSKNTSQILGDACPHSDFAQGNYDADSMRSILESQTVCSECKWRRAKDQWLRANRPSLAKESCAHGERARQEWQHKRTSLFFDPPSSECRQCRSEREDKLRKLNLMVCPHCGGEGWHNATHVPQARLAGHLQVMDIFLSLILPVAFFALVIGLIGVLSNNRLMSMTGLGIGCASAVILIIWSVVMHFKTGVSAIDEVEVKVDLRVDEDCPTCRGQCLIPAKWTRAWHGWGVWKIPGGYDAKPNLPKWLHKAP